MKKIFAVQLCSGLNFGGFVSATLNTRNNANIEIIPEMEGTKIAGLWFMGKKCHKYVPVEHVKDIDFVLENGEAPVAGSGKV